MITFGKTATKPNFMFGKLPLYFKTDDSYKAGTTVYTIDGVNQGNKTFTISNDGDLSSIFPDGRRIIVNGSSGNDGIYTIVSTLWSSPNFIITVEEAIPSASAGGNIGDFYAGEGLLERYLEIFCAEIDNEVSPYIDEVLSITDAEALVGLTRDNPTELLIHISELFGNPPDVGTETAYSGDEDEYIVLIRYIRHILQTKGTEQALIYFLAIYGYQIDTLTESGVTASTYDVSPTPLKYDDGGEYDYGFTFYSGFDLAIEDKPGMGTKNPPQAWLDDYLKPAIQNFIAPIWATLGTLTYS